MSTSWWSWVRGNAVALLALFVALSGTSYAAVVLPRNSVREPQIAPGAVRSSEIKDGSVARADLRDGLLPPSRLAPLAAGETLRGFVGLDLQVDVAGGDWRAASSFAVPLNGEPAAAYIDGVTPGDTCTGTADLPTAPPNTLCLYPRSATNPALGADSHYLVDVGRYGFAVTWAPTGTGDSLFFATYAFTEG